MVVSGFFFTASLLISKRWLASIPTGVLAVFRVGVGTLIYHVTVLVRGDVRPGTSRLFWDWVYWRAVWWSVSLARSLSLTSHGHLEADATRPARRYGLVYVTLAQSVWLTALAHAEPQTISIGTTTLFV